MPLVSSVENRMTWRTVMIATLTFWLSGSLILDTVLMPALYASGMMSEPGFATAGYSIFWVFNRVELVCAALVLTSSLVVLVSQQQTEKWSRRSVILALFLLALALIYTYALTPQMSALGLHLNLFDASSETPALMNSLHMGYWLLEVAKLVIGGLLLKLYYRTSAETFTLKGS